MAVEINRDLVTEHKATLFERYNDIEERETEFHVSDQRFSQLREVARDGHIGAAYAWVVRTADQAPPFPESYSGNDTDRVLLILHRGGTQWDIPGGGHKPGESFEETAVREVHEETSIDCDVTDATLVEHEMTVAGGYDERLHTLWVYFDGVYRDGSISIQNTELNGAAWFSERPQSLKEISDELADEWF